MKKLKLILLFLVIPIVAMIAQVVDPPTNVVDLVTDFNVFVGSLAGYAAFSVFVTGLINGWVKITKSWLKQVVSWLVPIILTVGVTFVLKTGFLEGEPILKVIIYGFGAGLVSNGLFDISFVNTAVAWIVNALGGITKK